MAGKIGLHTTLCSAVLLLVCSCALHYPPVDLQGHAPPELEGTPFFSQQKYQCGPAALATLLVDSGVDVEPEELVPLVYIPEKKGSFQVELLAAARRYGRISYVIDPDINGLAAELLAGRPVLVLQNYGLESLPSYHFAVVIGILPGDKVVLRSGSIRRQVMSMGRFLMSWVRSGSWAMVVLQPGELPENPDIERYVEAVSSFEDVAGAGLALDAYREACNLFPEEPLLLFALGNNALGRDMGDEAISSFRRVLEYNPGHVGAANNLADTLAKKGCYQQALQVIERLERELGKSEGKSVFFDTLQTTREEIEELAGKSAGVATGQHCP